MKYILSALLLSVALSATCQQVFHDPDAQVRQVGSFTGLDVSSAIELQLSQGGEDAVAVSVQNRNNADDIKTEVRNGVLRIWAEQKKWFKNNGKVRVYVSVKTLNRIVVSGASDINVNGVLNSSSLSIRMSGASDFNGEVKAGSLQIQLSGASDVSISGTANDVKAEASGASHLKGYGLVADNCLIDASGASDVKLTASKVINVEASGASHVSYQGQGQEGRIRSSGASSISKKG